MEKRLIDANAVRHNIEVHMAGVIHRGTGFIPSGKEYASAFEFLRGYEEGAKYIANLVLREEFLVDAVEVVRCKDCKFYEDHKRKIYENCVRGGRCVPMKPNDFCSFGERREGE